MKLFGIEHEDFACPTCMGCLGDEDVPDRIRIETVLPVPKSPRAPMSRFFKDKAGKHLYICFDCAAAEALIGFQGMGKDPKMLDTDFLMMRIATGNDRQEKLRLVGVPMGIPFCRVSESEDLDTLHEWHRRTIGDEEQRERVREDRKQIKDAEEVFAKKKKDYEAQKKLYAELRERFENARNKRLNERIASSVIDDDPALEENPWADDPLDF